MSRFGDTATIKWNSGDTFTGANTIELTPSQMPQYPFMQNRVTDEKQYRTKSGELYSYRNYNKWSYMFLWTNLDESKRDGIANMVDSIPIFNFASGGNNFGTFRVKPNSFKDKETSFELFDISFTAEETA